MTQQLSPRDWEYLSAYLDRQLKPKEIASLEARLSADPDLSAALGEMQRTRDALRSLPKMRAPRNFTLTPQMVGQRSPWRSRPAGRLAPVFGFASALATFLLILVVLGDVLGIFSPATQPIAQAPSRAPKVSLQGTGPTTVEATSAPLLGEAHQPSTAAAVESQAQEITQTLAATAPISHTLGAVAPSALAAGTPALTETVSTPMTPTAKTAAGMGAGEPTEPGTGLLPPGSIITPQGRMWVTILHVTVSPTETLNFPMTVTLEGVPITGTFNVAADNELPVEAPTQPEPTLTVAPTPPPAPVEPSLLAPTDTPEIVVRAVDTSTPSQPEPQTYSQTPVPLQAVASQAPSPQPARSGTSAVRILEITLAVLALVAGLAAGIAWWLKRF